MNKVLLALALSVTASPAFAQVPYDPPTAVKAAPNVFLLMHASEHDDDQRQRLPR